MFLHLGAERYESGVDVVWGPKDTEILHEHSLRVVQFVCEQSNPKDPAVLKILRVVNSLRVVFLVRRGDLLSRCTLRGHHFPGNYRHFPSQRRVYGVVNLGRVVVKTLRRSNSLFLLSS